MATYKEWKPKQSSRSKRIPAFVWDEMRPRMLEFYLTNDHTVEEVVELMAANYGFEATARQYRFQFDKWKVSKNVPGSVMRHGARKLHEEPQRHGFEYRQKEISLAAFKRFETLHPSFDPQSSPTASTPSQMDWETPDSLSSTPRATTPLTPVRQDEDQEDQMDIDGAVEEADLDEPVSDWESWRVDFTLRNLEEKLDGLFWRVAGGETDLGPNIGFCKIELGKIQATTKSQVTMTRVVSLRELLSKVEAHYEGNPILTWYCCNCNEGPWSVMFFLDCVNCRHRPCRERCRFQSWW